MANTSNLDAMSEDELRARLSDVLERLARLARDDASRPRLVAERLDVAAALRRTTRDENGHIAAWAERARHREDAGRPFVRSDGEGGGVSG